MSEKLLSCPFCGGEALTRMVAAAPALWRVSCKNCDASPSGAFGEAAAIEKWNGSRASAPTRPDREVVARIIAEQLGENYDKLVDEHLDPGFCKEDFRQCADALSQQLPTPSTASSDKVRPDAEWLTDKHAEFDNIFATTPTPSAATNVEPVAYWFVHPINGMDLSTDPLSSTAESLGWTSQPLYAAPPSPDAVREALELLVKYADWQISEGGSHHPTLRGAIDKARAALSGAPVAGEWQDKVKEIVDLFFAPWGAAKGARWESLSGDQPFNADVAMSLIEAAIVHRNDRAVHAGAPEVEWSWGRGKGCCSASSPCAHQKQSPTTLCEVCQQAADRAAAYALTGKERGAV